MEVDRPLATVGRRRGPTLNAISAVSGQGNVVISQRIRLRLTVPRYPLSFGSQYAQGEGQLNGVASASLAGPGKRDGDGMFGAQAASETAHPSI